ncbi:unnamed protein product [Protopolystoma xenopodis]|uniref:Uncharacterized protein n=1 Tax=Protopolystoma xenopodis TaxID=117903 RepID=A0A448XD22_9PLAT|nr:unnamed protein product [Protopolystoma xenopodis]
MHRVRGERIQSSRDSPIARVCQAWLVQFAWLNRPTDRPTDQPTDRPAGWQGTEGRALPSAYSSCVRSVISVLLQRPPPAVPAGQYMRPNVGMVRLRNTSDRCSLGGTALARVTDTLSASAIRPSSTCLICSWLVSQSSKHSA